MLRARHGSSAAASTAESVPGTYPSGKTKTASRVPGSSWKRSSAAIGLVAIALGLGACGGGSDDDPPISVPDPSPGPTPSDPTPVGFTKTGDIVAANSVDVGDRYTKDGREVVFDAVGNKYYELVPVQGTWDAARAAAAAAGGYLAVLTTPVEMLFVNQAYDVLGGPTGVDGTWVGAGQANGATAPGEAWAWIDGTALPADSELWNDEFGGLPLDSGLPENGEAQYGAIYNGLSSTDTKLLYDTGTATDTLPKFLIEYDNQASVK